MMIPKVSHYLNFIVPRCEGLLSDYKKLRDDMMYHGLAGDAAIDRAIILAQQVEDTLQDIGWHVQQGYEPSNPLPLEIERELAQRQLI